MIPQPSLLKPHIEHPAMVGDISYSSYRRVIHTNSPFVSTHDEEKQKHSPLPPDLLQH
jgi:hypothetical protein